MPSDRLCLAVLSVPAFALANHAEPPKPEDKGVPLAVTRDRAGVMHELYAETLEVVHHRCFRREGGRTPGAGAGGHVRPHRPEVGDEG